MSLARRVGLAAALLLACSREVPVPDDAQLTCAASADCPSGFLCHAGMCQRADAIDTTPPDLAAAPVVSPVVGKAGTTYTIDLLASEPLAEAPRVTLGLDAPVVRACASTDGTGYRCSYQATGAENGGKGGTVGFDVWLKDLGRNETSRKLAGVLRLDFDAPRVTTASVAYFPAPANPLPAVSRATGGTVVRVAVNADELLDAATLPSLAATSGAATLTFAVVPGTLSGDGAVFEAEVPGNLPDGDYLATVVWSDVAGNATDVEIATPAIRVKTSRPTLTIDQSQVTYVRSPWGNATSEDLGGFVLPAGPYFGLAPQDPLASASTLAPSVFSAGSTAAVAVRIWSDEQRASLLATLHPTGTEGAWPRARLQSVDVPFVWATVVDDAGNESVPVRIASSEWIGTSNPTALGTSPHRLAGISVADVVPSGQGSEGSGDILGPDTAGIDALSQLVATGAPWMERTSPGSPPVGRQGHAMAYDAARGRTVLFGGYVRSVGNSQDTWEFDGRTWERVTPAGRSPSVRAGYAMAFDGARGRVVLFGGSNGSVYLQDTWEWDGADWRDVTPAGPSPAGGPGSRMAYDSRRRRIVLLGGTSTWEWDGAAWRDATPAGAKPGVRSHHALAYDSVRERIVLFGGYGFGAPDYLADTWEWNGTAWADVTPAGGGPSARFGHSLAYDCARGRVVLFGGLGASGNLQDTWEWDGTAWQQLAAAPAPSARYDHALAFDGARGRTVLFGGIDSISPFPQDTWEWDGTAWSTGAQPGARRDTALAFHAASGRSLLFGGADAAGQALSDTWVREGDVWSDATSAGGPPARSGHALAYDDARGRVVLFGGMGGLGDTWEWDGSAWANVTPAGPNPGARYGHALAFDPDRRRIVLFGGMGSAGRLQDTWEWNGVSWSDVTPAGAKPIARSGHALAWDGANHRVMLFGGYRTVTGVSPYLGDTWEWNGSAWTDVTPVSAGPAARLGHALAWDGARGRVVLFGGLLGNYVQDLWEWNGSAWAQVAPPSAQPGGRAFFGFAYDGARARTLVVDGMSAATIADTWEWDTSPGRQPAIQVDATIYGAGIDAPAISGLRVRAFAAGSSSPDGGAKLLGWSTCGPRGEPGLWIDLAANAAGIAAQVPLVPAPPGSLLDWTATSAAEARRFVLERDGRLSFQVRPSGSAGATLDGARVALDYVEVRVRYLAP